MRTRKTPYQSSLEKGDKDYSKGKFKKALSHYRKARDHEPENPEIYDRLIDAHGKLEGDWTQDELTESLEWTMKKQELQNPALKRVHAQMEPEWKEINDLIVQMMQVGDDSQETALVEKIKSHGENSIYPLVELLLSFKKMSKKIQTEGP